ncbi:hypothetical protein [Streptomyces sp. NPDC058297]|uniref:hypothetical protein n=1 Tax=Streptomyces sp. NPDC058297 TaxID=3346433 RepID=UPI0036EBCFE5
MTETASDLIHAKEYAQRAWYAFTNDHRFKAIVPSWRVGPADAAPRLSVEVVGADAAAALRMFAAQNLLILGQPGDQRPAFDYSTPGRVTCVWRKYGVWIELWHPEAVAIPSPARPSAPRRVLPRPSGRLPFGRRNKTPKETTA